MIKSTVSERTMHIYHSHGGVEVEADGRISINFSPEDFAREVNAAGIPGLTVTYEKPVEIPTEPGVYLDNRDRVWRIDRRPGSGLYVVGAFDDYDPELFAPFTRLIPENESDV